MLTPSEKKILGVMTDEGLLRGDLRQQVAGSDDLARSMIAEYKQKKLNDITVQIKNLETKLERLKRLETDLKA